MRYRLKPLLCLIAAVTIGCNGANQTPNPENSTSSVTTSEEQLRASQAIKMADAIMARHPNRYGSWNYETATVLRGFEALYEATGEIRFYQYLKATVDSVISSEGVISGYNEEDYNIDEVKEGSLLLYLYAKTHEARYKLAADALRTQLLNHPRTQSGGFWHKNKYPWQMWLDGLYMGQPFYAHYSHLFNEPMNYDDIVFQLVEMRARSVDSQTGLLFHAWDESKNSSWANATTGQSPIFWGRSIGWYVMALVDVLDYLPEEYSDYRNQLIMQLQLVSAALIPYQDADGVWWQVTDRVGENSNWQESSATAMYVYAMAKGVRKGYLAPQFLTAAQKGWAGLNTQFIRENETGQLSLHDTCTGTGVGGSYSFYTGRARNINDPKGLGPYLLAGVEMEFLAQRGE